MLGSTAPCAASPALHDHSWTFWPSVRPFVVVCLLLLALRGQLPMALCFSPLGSALVSLSLCLLARSFALSSGRARPGVGKRCLATRA